jgi:hypothetical protein
MSLANLSYSYQNLETLE